MSRTQSQIILIITSLVLAAALTACSETATRSTETAASPAAEAESEGARAAQPPEVAVVEETEPTSEPEQATRASNATTAAAAEEGAAVNGLELRRLVVAHDVEDREPLGADSPFLSDGEPVFAFLELANENGNAQRVQVSFEPAEGRAIGPISLEVPGNVPRWRTWARSSWVRRPGQWSVVVRTEEGEIIQRAEFEVEG